MEETKETLDTQEAADYLKVSRGTLENWRVLNLGPDFYRPRGKVIYYKLDLDKWIKSRVEK